MNRYIVITGLSGAGLSTAADALQDLGWFVIDNLPPMLIPRVAELSAQDSSEITDVVFVTGIGPYHRDVLPAIESLRSTGHDVRVVFLEASTAEIVRRFENTRRRHPLFGETVVEAIEAERELLTPVRAEADVVLDTSSYNIHQLKARIRDEFGHERDVSGMQLSIRSFAYPKGLPLDADLVFDCRWMDNPHYDPELRPLTGADEAVQRVVFGSDGADEFVDRLVDLLAFAIPRHEAEGKAYLSVAFGCTGGRHRSIAVALAVADRLEQLGYEPRVVHRDTPM